MRSILVYKHSPHPGKESNGAVIDINLALPPFNREDDKHRRQMFKREAKAIADALFYSLPGGTIDALLVEMLDRKRSLLHVKY